MLISMKALDSDISLEEKVDEIVEYRNHVYFEKSNPVLEAQYKRFLKLYDSLKSIFNS